MITIPKKRELVSVFLIAMTLIMVAFIGRPLTVSASEQYYEIERYSFDRLFVVFDPNYGEFPAEETADGVRLPLRGETLTDFPPNPIRAGYTFDGWRLPGGETLTQNYLVVNGDIALTAMWVPYGTPPQNTPLPTQSPAPGASPSPTPAVSPSPSPSPSPGAASPTPNKAQDGYRPNPGTNPLAISFLIFLAVIGLGIAAFSIIKLAVRHAEAKDQYKADATRYEREARLTDFLEEDDFKI